MVLEWERSWEDSRVRVDRENGKRLGVNGERPGQESLGSQPFCDSDHMESPKKGTRQLRSRDLVQRRETSG